MTFSIFSFVFLALVLILFYGIRNSARPFLLLTASLVWLGFLDLHSCIMAVACTLATYLLSLLLDLLLRCGKQKQAVLVGNASIFLLVLLLAVLKWASRLLPLLPFSAEAKDGLLKTLILPLGLSYYLFQAIAYLKDVSRGTLGAEKKPVHFALYMCFFPKFLSGPIERAQFFLPQLGPLKKKKLFEKRRLSYAFSYLLYGFFMKTVVADRLGIYTRQIFSSYSLHGSLWLFLCSLMYTMQIYCDFAGYTAIAIGTARLFGLELSQNFRTPYLASSISDFWRRWHCSLSNWLRDMIYIPLGGNRHGRLRQCINVMIVFLVCGLWHGNGLQFLVWGLLHGLYSVADILFFRKKEKKTVHKVIGGILCFGAVAFAWIFFGSEDLGKALGFIRRLLTKGAPEAGLAAETAQLGIDGLEIGIILVSLLLVVLTDIVSFRAKLPFPEAIEKWGYVFRYLVFYAAILIIFIFGVYGPGYDAGNFMYMDF
ncbi:MAG: hypothetical protein K6E50_02445 [Lachnospiraceae bacterium]|nr:hypothetical protein [Lachnospiraceae bacterium]